MSKPRDQRLLPLRSAVVLQIAVHVGIAAGVLTFLGGVNAPLAIFTGLTAFAGTIPTAHQLLD
jgi:hypothetical protein